MTPSLKAIRRSIRTPVGAWTVSLLALVVTTAGMLSVRAHLDKAHIALVYLLVILLGSSLGGGALGLTLSGIAFIVFDWSFLPPYNTLLVENPLDWLVAAAFLITSVVAAQLLARAQRGAAQALARTAEVERLSALGAETLNAARPEDALAAIAEVIRKTLDVDTCEVYAFRGPERDPSLVAHAGSTAGIDPHAPVPPINIYADRQRIFLWTNDYGSVTVERLDGTVRVADERDPGLSGHIVPWTMVEDARVITIPLRVRSGKVGALRITNERGIELADAQRDFLDALSYYVALGAERVRLTAEASQTESFREADRLKNALLAAVSHDLRTPLTTVKALAHSIVERGAAPGDATASSIEEEVDRVTALVTDLLDLSRLTGGAIQFRVALTTADDLIGAALQRTAGLTDDHEIRVITCDGGSKDDVLVGRFDFVHSLRVLVNLIENAVKYSPARSVIDLFVRQHGDMIEISVADKGPGVLAEERERLFEPFYRAPGVPPDSGGAGLGLAIAHGLAIGQGGDLRYEPREGGGSVFVFSLPAAALPMSDNPME